MFVGDGGEQQAAHGLPALDAAAGTFVGWLPRHAGLADPADDARFGKLVGHAVGEAAGAAGFRIEDHVVGDPGPHPPDPAAGQRILIAQSTVDFLGDGGAFDLIDRPAHAGIGLVRMAAVELIEDDVIAADELQHAAARQDDRGAVADRRPDQRERLGIAPIERGGDAPRWRDRLSRDRRQHAMFRGLGPIAIEHAARRNRPGSLGPGLELARPDRRGDDVGKVVGLGGEKELVFGERRVDRPPRQAVRVGDARADGGAVGINSLEAAAHPVVTGTIGVGRGANPHRDVRHRRAQAGQHLLVRLVVLVLRQLLESDPGERLPDIGAIIGRLVEIGEFERLAARPGPYILVLVEARVRPDPRDHFAAQRLDFGEAGHRLADQDAFPLGAEAAADFGEKVAEQRQRLAGAARSGEQHLALRRREEGFLRTGLGDKRDLAVHVRFIGLDERNVLVVAQLKMMGTHTHGKGLAFFAFLFFRVGAFFRFFYFSGSRSLL